MFDQRSFDAYRRAILRDRWDLAINLFFMPKIERAHATKTAKRFWNEIDYQIFGQKQVKRHGKRLRRACFLERGTRNWHYHCIVQLPQDWSNREQICLGLKAAWIDLGDAGEYGRFEKLRHDNLWTPYIIKGEAWGADSYCPETSHLIA